MIQFDAPVATAPDGSIIGVIAEDPFEARAANASVLGIRDPIPGQAGQYILEHTLAMASAAEKAKAASQLLDLRRKGASIVLISHDEPLLEACTDEIWWVRERAIVARGDPAEVIRKYRAHVAQQLRECGKGLKAVLAPTIRNGDGRARIETIELLDQQGGPTLTWRSGEPGAIRVSVRFDAPIDDPVVGIMIRTRIGLNVYGTNTELERVHTGRVEQGSTVRVTFAFTCDLCPGDYTVTAASHDADGVWHDWLEDAVAFNVVDSRYTAGVANLRARVTLG